MTINKTIRRKGVHQAKIGGGFTPAPLKKIAIKVGSKPRAMKLPKVPGYFGSGHVYLWLFLLLFVR